LGKYIILKVSLWPRIQDIT